jgi:hypothetical protein
LSFEERETNMNFEEYKEIFRATLNDMLARIASLEDKVRELQYLLDVKE